jgi:hypothetical protein
MKNTLLGIVGALGVLPSLVKTIHEKLMETNNLIAEEIEYTNVLTALQRVIGQKDAREIFYGPHEQQISDFISVSDGVAYNLVPSAGGDIALVIENRAKFIIELAVYKISEIIDELKGLCIYDKAYTRVNVRVKSNNLDLYLRGDEVSIIEDVSKFINGEKALTGFAVSDDINKVQVMNNRFFIAARLGEESIVIIGETVMINDAGYLPPIDPYAARVYPQDTTG